MKYHLIYKITNIHTGKIYIGRHSTNKINDSYFGSGRSLKKEVKKLGRDSFKKEILFIFDNPEEMIAKENELLTVEFVTRDDNYNVGVGQGGLITHGPEARQKLREANTNYVTAKDKDGNTLRIPTNDPRYLSGELVHNLKGWVVVRDKDGNTFGVPKDDPRYVSGELVSIATGQKKSPETIEKYTKSITEYWANNRHSDEAIEKMRAANVNKVAVRDKDNNIFRVSVDDERIKSGELVIACVGSKWVHNDELQKSRFVNPEKAEQYIADGWEYGLVYYNKVKRVWISNKELNKSKHSTEDKLDEYLANGWELGRIPPENFGSKISAGRTIKRQWMHNVELNKRLMIALSDIEQYIADGWKLGKKFIQPLSK